MLAHAVTQIHNVDLPYRLVLVKPLLSSSYSYLDMHRSSLFGNLKINNSNSLFSRYDIFTDDVFCLVSELHSNDSIYIQVWDVGAIRIGSCGLGNDRREQSE